MYEKLLCLKAVSDKTLRLAHRASVVYRMLDFFSWETVNRASLRRYLLEEASVKSWCVLLFM